MSRRTAVRLGAALVVLLAGPALAACRVERRAVLTASLAEGFVSVPAEVGGRPARFLLDTGAAEMLVTPGAAARLGLAPDPSRGTVLLGTGGAGGAAPNASLDGLRLGGAVVARRSVPVAPLPSPAPADADGLVGAPLLAEYDLDLDLARGEVRLAEVAGCPAGAPLVPVPFTAVPLSFTPDRLPLIPVEVNGVRLAALLDTGSRATVLTPGAAARVGTRALPGAAEAATGVDGRAVAARYARVATLAVGWSVQRDVQVAVAPLEIGGADALLGVDWLRYRRVWVSPATKQVLIALYHDWR